jgi:hypothetical protein
MQQNILKMPPSYIIGFILIIISAYICYKYSKNKIKVIKYNLAILALIVSSHITFNYFYYWFISSLNKVITDIIFFWISQFIGNLLISIFSLLYFDLSIKRLTDLSKPRWYVFILLIPIINIYILILLHLFKSETVNPYNKISKSSDIIKNDDE